METKKILGYVPIALLIVLLYLSYQVIRPFLSTIVGALIIAYVVYPIYTRLVNKTKRENVSAMLITLMIVVFLTIPVVFVLNSVVNEANVTYLQTRQYLDDGVFSEEGCEQGGKGIFCTVAEKTNNIVTGTTLEFYIRESIKRFALFITESAGKTIVALPSSILHFFLILFIVFFTLRDGRHFFSKLDSTLPMDVGDRRRIFNGVKNMTFGVIYGSVIVAIIQGVMGGLGFAVFGISSPIIWGTVMGLLAFIPLIGPMLIWFPASLLLLIDGITIGDNGLLFKGFGLIIYGVVFISSIENILKPMIIGNRVKTHPVIIIIGVLGGLKAFGILGLVVGPLVLELLITFIQIVKEHWQADLKKKGHK